MTKAIWNGAVIAQSAACRLLEGNYYFPPQDVDTRYLRESRTRTRCSWKGIAHYYDVIVDGTVNQDAAWTYPAPSDAAGEIAGYIAFWHGVQIER